MLDSPSLLDSEVQERTRFLKDQEQLLRKERLIVLGQLAGSLAHQIRTPLATALSPTSLINPISPVAAVCVPPQSSLLKAP